jgi:hypothetical protein
MFDDADVKMPPGEKEQSKSMKHCLAEQAL